MALTRDQVPEEVRGVEPSWAVVYPDRLAWGPFVVVRGKVEAPGWGLAVEDVEGGGRLLSYSIEGRRIALVLLGGPHVVGRRLEALCDTILGREAVQIRPVNENDRRLLPAFPAGEGPLVERMRDAIGW